MFFTLLGPSGCGKTTLLKVIGGYLTPTGGTVRFRGRDVTLFPPEVRNVGMVFQNYAIFPHLSARRNVSFGLEVRGLPKSQCLERADAMLERVGITSSERDRSPAHLSGGQQQRVALARALVIQPDLLLIDEPLANIDRHLREQLLRELRRLQRETGVTTVMVTHDHEEALSVSHRIGVMALGRLLQVGTPEEVYHQPRTEFVARVLGEANLLSGRVFGFSPHTVVMVRPEHCVLGPAATQCRWHWIARVRSRKFLGADVLAEVECVDGPTVNVRYRPAIVGTGGQVNVGIPAQAAWVVPEVDPSPL